MADKKDYALCSEEVILRPVAEGQDKTEYLSRPVEISYNLSELEEGKKNPYYVLLLGSPDFEQVRDEGMLRLRMEAEFPGLPEQVSVQELRDKLEEAVKEPWFYSRMDVIAADVAWAQRLMDDGDIGKRVEERIYTGMKDLFSRVSFIRDGLALGHEQEPAVRIAGEKTADGMVYDYTKRTGNDTESEWSVIRESVMANGKPYKDKHVYDNYADAKRDIIARFDSDYERYAKYMTGDERMAARKAFRESLDDKLVRHPHYAFKGSFQNKEGRTCFFDVKAEVSGLRVRSVPVNKNRFQLRPKAREKAACREER